MEGAHLRPAERGGFREQCLSHPLRTTLLLTLFWHAALVTLATVIPAATSQAGEDLRAAAINVLTALLPVAVLARLSAWRSAGLTTPVRRPVWLLPLAAVAVAAALTGLGGTTTLVVTTVVLQLCLGLNEEMMSRGVVQTLTAHLGGWRCAGWVGLLFGAGHAFNAVFFGVSWFDAGGQVLSATVGGFCFAAVRFHVLSLWPFVLLHAAENSLRDLSGTLTIPAELALTAVLAAYGCYAAATVKRAETTAVALDQSA